MRLSSDAERRLIEKSDHEGDINAVVQIVGLTEFFTFDRILRCVDAHVEETANAMLSALYRREASNIDRTWKNVETAADEYLGVGIAQFPAFERLMGLVEIRNAAMHGHGRLTRRQIKDQSVSAKLRRVGVGLDGNELLLPPQIIYDAARDCRSFVMDLDAQTWHADS